MSNVLNVCRRGCSGGRWSMVVAATRCGRRSMSTKKPWQEGRQDKSTTSTTTTSNNSKKMDDIPFTNRPTFPSLPAQQQREFEQLVKNANSTAHTTNVHPDFRNTQKAAETFKGDRNPETGEVGGPKTDPLRHGDWSFGGRTSDF